MMTQEDNRAEEQAQAQLESIVEMVKALTEAEEKEDEEAREEAYETIQEDPLSVEVRSDWHTPGSNSDSMTEYRILLCTGGPAVQITGDLDAYGQPETATLQYQDWFTPWEDYSITDLDEQEALLTYARQFYFGE